MMLILSCRIAENEKNECDRYASEHGANDDGKTTVRPNPLCCTERWWQKSFNDVSSKNLLTT